MGIVRLTCLAVLTLSTPGVLALPGTASAAAPATCHGKPVTITGAQGQPVVGTPGPDVIATDGSTRIKALGGDDTICVTSDPETIVTVVAGAGDDYVDTTAFRPPGLSVTRLGAGDDTFIGGVAHDVVKTTGRNTATLGTDTVNTGPGSDEIDLGRHANGHYDGGGNNDSVAFSGLVEHHAQAYPNVIVNLRRESLTGTHTNAHVFNMEGVLLSRVISATVIAGASRNEINIAACSSRVNAGSGDDDITAGSYPHHCRDRKVTGMFARGGRGDDVLTGAEFDDVLLGGPGDDHADGFAGIDTCQAETAYCEEKP